MSQTNHTAATPHMFATDAAPTGALPPLGQTGQAHIAVEYERGAEEPEISLEQTATGVQTVYANGVAVAVVARARGPALSMSDIVLVERT